MSTFKLFWAFPGVLFIMIIPCCSPCQLRTIFRSIFWLAAQLPTNEKPCYNSSSSPLLSFRRRASVLVVLLSTAWWLPMAQMHSASRTAPRATWSHSEWQKAPWSVCYSNLVSGSQALCRIVFGNFHEYCCFMLNSAIVFSSCLVQDLR